LILVSEYDANDSISLKSAILAIDRIALQKVQHIKEINLYFICRWISHLKTIISVIYKDPVIICS
jgi:hypothetical protein